MKLLYLANIRLPTEKAHGVQIMKMCEAFARQGAEVELVVPTRQNDLVADPFEYYGVEKNFIITYVNSPDVLKWPLIGFWLQSFLFALRSHHLLRQKSFDVLYGRDELPLYIVSRKSSCRVAWESHTGSWNFFTRRTAHKAKLLVAISQGLKDFYVERGVPEEKIIIAHDGVDLQDFANPESREASRGRLNLPIDKKIAMYIGRLDMWKGVETLLEASKLLPDVLVVLIGGEPAQVAELSQKYPAVKFLGYRPYTELPGNQQAADVLVLPNTGRDEISAMFTSPLKLFTYMASGVPMVASDLPSIREVVSGDEVYFAQPDNPGSFADAITKALADPEAPQKAARAKEKAVAYTWEARAKYILQKLA